MRPKAEIVSYRPFHECDEPYAIQPALGYNSSFLRPANVPVVIAARCAEGGAMKPCEKLKRSRARYKWLFEKEREQRKRLSKAIPRFLRIK